MGIVANVISVLNIVMSAWLIFMLVYVTIISFFGFKRNTKDYQDHPPKLRYLILVPAHNEEHVISGIIKNLQNMRYPKELFDFYILADNCTDGTVALAQSLGAKVIESRKKSPDDPTGKPIVLEHALRELGEYHKKYDLVMFFDADNLVDADMLAEVNSQFLDNPKADIIQCYLGSKNKRGVVALFYYMSYTITNRFFQYAKHRLHLNCVIGGTGFAVRADYLYNRGGWTAMSLTEDFELQIEATAEGRRILWNHNVRIYDEKPTRVRASLRQRTRWAQGHWFVALKNTARMCRALVEKRVSFAEFVSTILYMYSVTTYVILVVQLLFSLIMALFQWFGWVEAAGAPPPFREWLLVNLPGIGVFLYSFIFCFFIADRWDNGKHFNVLMLAKILFSIVLNNVLVCIAQVVGLLKHRNQHVWVKTEHTIMPTEEDCLKDADDKLGEERDEGRPSRFVAAANTQSGSAANTDNSL